jgi:hypothetical protein
LKVFWHGAYERLPELVEVGEPNEIVFGEKAANFPRRIELSVPEPDFVAICQENKGSNAVLGSEGVGVIGRLTFAFEWISAGTFGFHDGEGAAEAIEESIVGELVNGVVRNFLICEGRRRRNDELFN